MNPPVDAPTSKKTEPSTALFEIAGPTVERTKVFYLELILLSIPIFLLANKLVDVKREENTVDS